jgi:hypothetical protein
MAQSFFLPVSLSGTTQLAKARAWLKHDCHIMDEARKLGIHDEKQLFDVGAVQVRPEATALSGAASARGGGTRE